MNRMGSDLAATQSFYRLYLVPAMGHGLRNGTSNPAANPPVPTFDRFYSALTDWVEKGIAPNDIALSSASSTPEAKSHPICVYPKKTAYVCS